MKNSLTQEDINNAIKSEVGYTLGLKTIAVVLTLQNGFEVVGVSGCVDPANYNYDVGYNIARKRAEDKVWELEGYFLQCKVDLQKSIEAAATQLDNGEGVEFDLERIKSKCGTI